MVLFEITCEFPNLKKKILSPPPPNPGYAPGLYRLVCIVYYTDTSCMSVNTV